MSQISDLLRDTPELRRTQLPLTRLPGSSSLSDSELEPDFDIDVEDATPPTLEPLFCAFTEDDDDDDHHLYHQHDVTFKDADLGLYFGSGWSDHQQRRGLFDDGERVIVGSEVNLELGLGLGLGLGGSTSSSSSLSNHDGTRRFEGLRAINLDSDSESDDGKLPDYDFEIPINNNNNNNSSSNNTTTTLGFGGVSDFDRPPFCWDYLGFNNNRGMNEGSNQEIDYDELLYSGGGDYVVDNVDAGVSTLFDAYQEREEQREIVIDEDDLVLEEEDEDVLELEWDTQFALNYLYSEVYDMDFTVDMYEAILGEVEDSMNDWMGSPPASKAVIESLPAIKLSNDGGLKENEVVCTVCRDEFSEEEVVRQLPCLHYYHGDCILPWLQIRNTCPICRFELPTDDAEYEWRKRQRNGENGGGVVGVDDVQSLDSQVSSIVFHAFL